MSNFEGELYETCEEVPEASELMWRFRIMDAENPDAVMAEVLAVWAHKANDEVGSKICGVIIERV